MTYQNRQSYHARGCLIDVFPNDFFNFGVFMMFGLKFWTRHFDIFRKNVLQIDLLCERIASPGMVLILKENVVVNSSFQSTCKPLTKNSLSVSCRLV